MNEHARILQLSEILRLTPYQTAILEKNSHLYDLSRLVKRGGVLYVPYRNSAAHPWRDAAARLVLGQMADLIGPDDTLACGVRGAKLYSDGRVVVPNSRGR